MQYRIELSKEPLPLLFSLLLALEPRLVGLLRLQARLLSLLSQSLLLLDGVLARLLGLCELLLRSGTVLCGLLCCLLSL